MRHRKQRSKLSMKTAHRNAMLNNMARNLLTYQRVETTVARAKVARRLVEHLITLSKKDSVASRRMAYRTLKDRDMVMKLFKEIAPLFNSRSSGFTRIIPIGFRRGDGASMCIFELTEKKIVEKLARKKKEKKEVEADQTAASEQKTAVKSKLKETQDQAKDEPRVKPIPKAKPHVEEEKRTEKARKEDRKIADKKGFMKNLRGFFRRKTDM